MVTRPSPFAWAALAAVALAAPVAAGDDRDGDGGGHHGSARVQLGPRPYYLVDGMDEGTLKDRCGSARTGPFRQTTSPSRTGAPPCSSRSTRRRPTKRVPAWEPASSSAT